MLNDRINLGNALHPFENYKMDYAVGTTYSLSLEALMFIPVTLFFGDELVVTEKVLSSELLHALSKVPEQVQLFCQRGKIQKPSFYHSILAFWERSIEQVQLDSHRRSFHPKIWLVRYVPVKEKLPVKYRFICGSRNLTLSRDWDAAVTMNGTVIKTKKQENGPLLEFLKMLNEQATKKIKPELMQELLHIDFELNEQQTAYRFHPMGFDGREHPVLSSMHREKLLVISPFLHHQTIREHRNRSNSLYLFSNSLALDSISQDVLNQVDEVYMFHPKLEQKAPSEPEKAETDEDIDNNVNGNIEPDDSYNPGMNLHAKLYISQNQNSTSWFIGSANCTEPARDRNIEFLTEITYMPGKATINDVKKALLESAKGEGLFVRFERSSEGETEAEKQNDAALRLLTYELSALRFQGEAIAGEDGHFNLHIRLESAPFTLPAGWQISIVPLSAHEQYRKTLCPDAGLQLFSWEHFQEIELTPFLLVYVELPDGISRQFVLDIQINFSPDRIKKIFKNILSSQVKLFKYLSAMLANEETIPLLMLDERESHKSSQQPYSQTEHLPLYEKLLLAASRDPDKIKSAATTISYLAGELDQQGRPIVDEAFARFFEIFKPFAEDE